MSEETTGNTTPDRDPVTNRFVKGNNAGRRKPAKVRKLDYEPTTDTVKEIMLAEFTTDDIRSMLRAQMTKAQTGDTNAAKFIRDGIWGKPKVSTTDKESSFISALMDYAESKTIIDTDNK